MEKITIRMEQDGMAVELEVDPTLVNPNHVGCLSDAERLLFLDRIFAVLRRTIERTPKR